MNQRESATDEWRRLLKGGFTFQTARFAVHPLDRQRAERMFFVATRAGATKPEILDEARVYLQYECGVRADFLDGELERVETFLSQYRLTGKAKNAWLVFWNSSSSYVTDVTSNLVQVLDPRISERRICEFLELHYRAVEYSPKELLYYSTRPRKNPYKARGNFSKGQRLLSYSCGHNPWLEARFCHDITVWDFQAEATKVSWNCNP